MTVFFARKTSFGKLKKKFRGSCESSFSPERVNDAEKIRITFEVKSVGNSRKTSWPSSSRQTFITFIIFDRPTIRVAWKLFMGDKKVRDTLK